MVLWVEKFSNTQFLEKFGHSFRSTLTFCVRAGMVFVGRKISNTQFLEKFGHSFRSTLTFRVCKERNFLELALFKEVFA